MKRLILAALTAVSMGAPVAASHINSLDTPFATRGACEAAVAQLSADDRDQLLDRYPNLFSRTGDVASFLTRAFPCERDSSDGQYYIQDNRLDVLSSDWFQRRP